jgi:hypothetical protein
MEQLLVFVRRILTATPPLHYSTTPGLLWLPGFAALSLLRLFAANPSGFGPVALSLLRVFAAIPPARDARN